MNAEPVAVLDPSPPTPISSSSSVCLKRRVVADAEVQAIARRLDRLRVELVDLAFELECRGKLDAADVANTTAAQVRELCAEFAE